MFFFEDENDQFFQKGGPPRNSRNSGVQNKRRTMS